MARIDTSGIDDIIKDMTRLGITESGVADDMLVAGAGEVREAWRKTAEKHKFRDTGDMIASIGFPRKPKSIQGILTMDIYPQGKDAKGIRNAEKAFILHYGTSSDASVRRGQRKAARRHKKYRNPGIPPTHWVDEAETIAAEPVTEAMERVYDEYLKKEGLI